MTQDIKPLIDGWLICKRGLYYRPQSAGYTGIKSEAGRYSGDDAKIHNNPRDGVTIVHETEAPEYSKGCCAGIKSRDMERRLKAAQAREAELVEVVAGFERKMQTYVSVYPGDKELRKILRDCRAALTTNGET